MRLINADKLRVEVVHSGNIVCLPHFSLEQINTAPVVEAIPIELIKKKLLSCQYEYENDYDKGFDMGWNCAIKTLLKDWEKENETKTDRC